MNEITYQDAINKILELKQNENSSVLNLTAALTKESSISNYDYDKALNLLNNTRTQQDQKIRGNETLKHSQEPSAIENLIKDAEKELGTTVLNISKDVITDIKDMSIPSVRKNKLVLVYLSTEDQINELEKINLGLDQNVFDKEQLDVIKEEINGLDGYVKSMNKKGLEVSGDSQIRNERLEEVIKKLDNTIK
ncbi:MAG: hypothetical protein QXD23_01295 [Candidatus Micrarchaeaceae archaeon]